MKKFQLILIIFIGLFVFKAFADEAQIRNDQEIWVEVGKKLSECKSLGDKYIQILDTNMIDDIEIIIEDKQKVALEADYDQCKIEFQTSVAKF